MQINTTKVVDRTILLDILIFDLKTAILDIELQILSYMKILKKSMILKNIQ